jgi:chromosomal replication initiation ATPase DnaA
MYIEEKVTVVRRHYFYGKDPHDLVQEVISNGLTEGHHVRTILDTMELVKPTANKGAPTKMLFDQSGNVIAANTQSDIQLDHIVDVVCQRTGVMPKSFLNRSRKRTYVEPLRLICYFSNIYNIHPNVVANFINRDRTSVLHHIKVGHELAEVDKKFQYWIREISRDLNQLDINKIKVPNKWKSPSLSASEDKKELIETESLM